METNVLNSLWVEKYRPRELEDVVLEDHQRKFVGECLQKEEIPKLRRMVLEVRKKHRV